MPLRLFCQFGTEGRGTGGNGEGGTKQGQVDPFNQENKQEEGRDGLASQVENGTIVQK